MTKLCDLGPRDGVCSVQWTREGSYLAIGTLLGDVQVLIYHARNITLYGFMLSEIQQIHIWQIWDSTRCKKIRTMGGRQTRTGVLTWSSRILSSGGRDKNILQHDIRVSSDFVSKLTGHRSEVICFAWINDSIVLVLIHLNFSNRYVGWNGLTMIESWHRVEMTIRCCSCTLNDHKLILVAMNWRLLVEMSAAISMEPALSAASFETHRAYSCSQSHRLVTASARPSCVRRRNCRSMHPFLEHSEQ